MVKMNKIYFMLPDRMLSNEKFSPKGKLVLGHLLSYFSLFPDGKISLNRLSQKFNIPEDKMSTILKSFVFFGFISMDGNNNVTHANYGNVESFR